jgi:histidine triad (HIT) family protein
MTDCLFCKIRDGQIPATKVHEDTSCFAFRDIHPQAPTHILVVPREHIPSLNELDEGHAALVGHMLVVGARLAKTEGHAENGWRCVFNVNKDGGQTVFHVHMHVLAGRRFSWPPG